MHRKMSVTKAPHLTLLSFFLKSKVQKCYSNCTIRRIFFNKGIKRRDPTHTRKLIYPNKTVVPILSATLSALVQYSTVTMFSIGCLKLLHSRQISLQKEDYV